MCYITQPRYIIETMLTTYHSSSPYTTLFRSQGDEQLTAFGLRLPVEQSRGGCLHRLGGNQTRVVRSTGGGSRQEVTGSVVQVDGHAAGGTGQVLVRPAGFAAAVQRSDPQGVLAQAATQVVQQAAAHRQVTGEHRRHAQQGDGERYQQHQPPAQRQVPPCAALSP